MYLGSVHFKLRIFSVEITHNLSICFRTYPLTAMSMVFLKFILKLQSLCCCPHFLSRGLLASAAAAVVYEKWKLCLKNRLSRESWHWRMFFRRRERVLQFIWKLLVLTRLSYLHSYRVCSHVVFVSLLPCGQSYKSSTIVNYVTLASCWREICN